MSDINKYSSMSMSVYVFPFISVHISLSLSASMSIVHVQSMLYGHVHGHWRGTRIRTHTDIEMDMEMDMDLDMDMDKVTDTDRRTGTWHILLNISRTKHFFEDLDVGYRISVKILLRYSASIQSDFGCSGIRLSPMYSLRIWTDCHLW
jgi:hypothetical protein